MSSSGLPARHTDRAEGAIEMSGQVNWFELPADDTGRARTF
ncbi:VOC family protein [Lentzea jiangxiensis]|uniref:Uncharacterized protein n=1 Tax=Lentzea jiangxiensis TaxID=641025 RepID=A0A1H0IGI3_9PSEU|nr:hypothetical protein [Lentzea jiangxiensis]SDO30161.1 hypothetical protein SAMN05421507_10283 [Lentzea jiangxiensis]